MTYKNPPFDGSAVCPCCPLEIRNLFAVADGIANNSSDVTIEDLRRAVQAVHPLVLAHFADSMHAQGKVRVPDNGGAR